jgi:hypothetical protein
MVLNAPAVPPLSDLEVYDTESAPKPQSKAIDGRGERLALWGQIKSDYIVSDIE